MKASHSAHFDWSYTSDQPEMAELYKRAKQNQWDADELLPWDFVDHRVDKRYLVAERRKAHAELQTPPCDTHTCHSCGAC